MNQRTKRDFFVFVLAVFFSTMAFGLALAGYTHGLAGWFQALYGAIGMVGLCLARLVAMRHKRRQQRRPVQAVRRRNRRSAPCEPVFQMLDALPDQSLRMKYMKCGQQTEPQARAAFVTDHSR